MIKRFILTYPEEILEDKYGTWCKAIDVKALEAQNKEMLECLIDDVKVIKEFRPRIDSVEGLEYYMKTQIYTSDSNIAKSFNIMLEKVKIIENVTGKKIDEVLKSS